MAEGLFTDKIALELNLSPRQVAAVIKLFEEGCTVPFIARYRKEKGISQEKLCAELQRRGCDIARSCYAKYEAGELSSLYANL